ncbi:hypothetical protein B0H21DRAFT_757154 [Amylocystis lapponica]|nr:hypothetical protein B0H21DRAFT_757154 [Amylocystis lapponica]
MENVGPTMSSDNPRSPLPTLDDLLRPAGRNAKTTRPRHSRPLVFAARANVDSSESSRDDLEFGLLTPPSSQQEDDGRVDMSRMLISPPPEETLRSSARNSVPRSKPSSVPPFTPSLLADPSRHSRSTSSLSHSKRKRAAPSISSISSLQDITPSRNRRDDITSASAGTGLDITPNPKPRKQSRNAVPSASQDSLVRSDFLDPSHLPTTPTKVSSSRPSQSPSKRTLLRSPHAANPEADYIPPVLSHTREHISRRRSATPIPPYEPPAERFTPPREILYTPPASHAPKVSKSSKRKSAQKGKSAGKKLTLLVKKELPDIDMSLPLPPPSPTDDPLLLSGPPRRPKPRLSFPSSTYSRETPSIASSSPIHQQDVAETPLQDLQLDSYMEGSDFDSDEPIPPVFNFDDVMQDGGGDSWSDSDEGDGDFDQTGEYTGKFKVLTVPVKADPPSSCTRGRMDAWGRPISPFPRRVRASLPHDTEHGRILDIAEEQSDIVLDDDLDKSLESVVVSSATIPSSLEFQDGRSGDADHLDLVEDDGSSVLDADDTVLQEADVTMEDAVPTTVHDALEQSETMEHALLALHQSPTANPASIPDDIPAEPFAEQDILTSPDAGGERSAADDDESEEDIVVRELSREPDAESDEEEHQEASYRVASRDLPRTPYSQKYAYQPDDLVLRTETLPSIAIEEHSEAGSSDDEDSVPEGDVVKIMSDDPRAAAHAAAILKMHDYDCLPQLPSTKRKSMHLTADTAMRTARRKTCLDSGIAKRSSAAYRRHTLGGLIGDKVFIPGSPMMTLPQLLQEAEASLVHDDKCMTPPRAVVRHDIFKTPVSGSRSFEMPSAVFSDQSLSSPPPYSDASVGWTKGDWKRLDSCFTDERLAVGASKRLGNTLADVDEVSLQNVVDRFLRQAAAGSAHGLLISDRAQMLKRAQALQRKQRSGNVAPPTPNGHHSVVSSAIEHPNVAPGRALGGRTTNFAPARSVQTPKISREGVTAVSEARVLPFKADQLNSAATSRTSRPAGSTQSSLATRMRGLLFSYLPVSSKRIPSKKTQPVQIALPIPPAEIFSKPRQPISTPVAKPPPKPAAPKDLVQLHPVPPPKPSMIPRVTRHPRRLVELHPPPLLGESTSTASASHVTQRRTSGGSVRSLIQNFEDLKASHNDPDQSLQLRRTKSVGEWLASSSMHSSSRPTWRP